MGDRDMVNRQRRVSTRSRSRRRWCVTLFLRTATLSALHVCDRPLWRRPCGGLEWTGKKARERGSYTTEGGTAGDEGNASMRAGS